MVIMARYWWGVRIMNRADLSGANLRGANLRGANLSGMNLSGADLSGTCLDPAGVVRQLTVGEIETCGLQTDGNRIYGWRTLYSQHYGNTEYTEGEHVASVFSIDENTECHPGIYFASLEWLASRYSGPFVQCWAYMSETVHAGDKWRAKRIFVYDPNAEYERQS